MSITGQTWIMAGWRTRRRLHSRDHRGPGGVGRASDVLEAWSEWMFLSEPEHESIRPYDQLSPSVQNEDAPSLTAIHSAARARAESS